MREITGLNLAITNYCNLACPDCCCNVPHLPAYEHVTWDYLVSAAPYLGGLHKINITGGEPLLHPHFDAWAPVLKGLFHCELLYIETNAFLAPKHTKALSCFDKIFASRYTAATYAEGQTPYACDNTAVIAWLERQLPERLVVNDMQHKPRSLNRQPCPRAFAPQVAYWFGRVYPCCIGPGAEGSPSVELSPTWKADVATLQPACEGCFFAEP